MSSQIQLWSENWLVHPEIVSCLTITMSTAGGMNFSNIYCSKALQ